MTEKRFSVKQRQGATNYSINDYCGELPLSEGIYYKSNADKLCEWLNTQHGLLNTLYKDNEQLKARLNALHDENEWLKSEIQKLYNFVKIDVEHNIEVYPKSFMEHILGILKIIGDFE